MPTITLKNVPEDLHRRLKARAARNRRSLNSEVIHCLETVVLKQPAGEAELLNRIRANRASMAERGVWITEASLREAIEEGRA